MVLYIYIYTVVGSLAAFGVATEHILNCVYARKFWGSPIFKGGSVEILVKNFSKIFLRQDLFWVRSCQKPIILFG